MLSKLEKVLFALQVLFQFIDLVFVDFCNVLFLVASVGNDLLLHKQFGLKTVSLLCERFDSSFPEFVFLGHLGESILELSIIPFVALEQRLDDVFVDLEGRV